MKKLTLLLFILLSASAPYAADVKYTFIDASCDNEGRGIFYFILDYEAPFSSSEAKILGIPGDWYDCVEAHCSYDYYDQPPGTAPKLTINSGREYMLITPPLTFTDSRAYNLQFTYPTRVRGGEGYAYDTIGIQLDCPGYDFSCSLYDFELDGCVSGDGKFRMDMTVKGLNQPYRINLIDDFRYGIVGEKTQIIDDKPLTEASVKYKESASVSPDKARITMLGKDRYYIEFPYGDTARWLTVKGRYCRHERDRFGKSTNFEYITTKKCAVREFIVNPVEDKPAEEPEEAPAGPTKYYPVPEPKKETAPKEPAKQAAAEEPEKEAREVSILSFLRFLLAIFRE